MNCLVSSYELGLIDAGGGTGDNSGSYYSGGGGGGGIITVLYEDAHIATQPTACGGRGHQNGGAGFVYLTSTKPGQEYSKVKNCLLQDHNA